MANADGSVSRPWTRGESSSIGRGWARGSCSGAWPAGSARSERRGRARAGAGLPYICADCRGDYAITLTFGTSASACSRCFGCASGARARALQEARREIRARARERHGNPTRHPPPRAGPPRCQRPRTSEVELCRVSAKVRQHRASTQADGDCCLPRPALCGARRVGSRGASCWLHAEVAGPVAGGESRFAGMDDVQVEGSSATFHVAEYATEGRLLAQGSRRGAEPSGTSLPRRPRFRTMKS